MLHVHQTCLDQFNVASQLQGLQATRGALRPRMPCSTLRRKTLYEIKITWLTQNPPSYGQTSSLGDFDLVKCLP